MPAVATARSTRRSSAWPPGTDLLGILRQDGTAVGMGFLVDGGSPLRRHWRTVLRLMVRPELQGRGAGRLLLEGLHGPPPGSGSSS